MNPLQKSQRIANLAHNEKQIQMPDYEWMQIKHNKKIALKGLKELANSLNSLYTNLTGENHY